MCLNSTLTSRRTELNLKFAKNCLKSDKYNSWFCEYKPTEQQDKTRSVNPNLLVPVQGRTKKFLKSPISYLTNLINESYSKPS